MGSLLAIVTAHACSRAHRAVGKAVTVLAAGQGHGGRQAEVEVDRRAYLRMAGGAQVRRRGCKAISVTLLAGDLVGGDMHLMPRCLPHFTPRFRNVVGALAFARGVARGDRDEHAHARHRARSHLAPTGWHSLHGIADVGSRLDHPGGCGLPPTPPTRWHDTHSISPAPPWHVAHDAGSRRASRPCKLSAAASPTQPGGWGLRAVSPATLRARWQPAHRSGA